MWKCVFQRQSVVRVLILQYLEFPYPLWIVIIIHLLFVCRTHQSCGRPIQIFGSYFLWFNNDNNSKSHEGSSSRKAQMVHNPAMRCHESQTYEFRYINVYLNDCPLWNSMIHNANNNDVYPFRIRIPKHLCPSPSLKGQNLKWVIIFVLLYCFGEIWLEI